MDKRRILELYLNFAEWGDGVFGAEAAARHHFGVPAAGLDPAQAAWLAAVLEKVGTGKSVGSEIPDARWVTIAFTWNGLRALGVDEGSLATFPEEFRQGMAARAEILGTTGTNHPDRWVGGLTDPALHAIARHSRASRSISLRWVVGSLACGPSWSR